MSLRKFVIADIEGLEIQCCQILEDILDFLCSIGSLEFERDEDLGDLFIIISVNKLGSSSRVDNTVELDETAWSFGDLDTENSFSAFTKLGTFGNKPETLEVHIRPADYGDETFLCADEVVFLNIMLKPRERKGTRGLCDRSRLWG